MKMKVYDIKLTMDRSGKRFTVDYTMAGESRDDAINSAMLAFRSLDRTSMLVSFDVAWLV